MFTEKEMSDALKWLFDLFQPEDYEAYDEEEVGCAALCLPEVCMALRDKAETPYEYGRMIEIYLMVSLAPIPFSTFSNREQNQIGQNYLRSLFALGFQGFLIIICVGIYAVLVQSLAFTDDIIADIWGIMGYTVLLCFTLFKTGTLAKSVFNAH